MYDGSSVRWGCGTVQPLHQAVHGRDGVGLTGTVLLRPTTDLTAQVIAWEKNVPRSRLHPQGQCKIQSEFTCLSYCLGFDPATELPL